MRTQRGRAFSRRRGMTLVEVVLALALCAMIMGAVSIFIFSMGDLWGRGNEVRMFQRHVDGVTRFLNHHLHRAELFPDNLDGGRAERPVFLASPRPGQAFDNLRLTFLLAESPGLLPWPQEPLPMVVCHLEFDGEEGLVLLWHSLLEEDFGEREARRLQLSPYLEEVVFWYWDEDAERWEERADWARDRENEEQVPDRLELHFAWEGLREQRTITLPGKGLNALHGRRW